MNPKVVLITGGGRGPGRALAEALAAQGWYLAVNDLNPITIDEVVEQITKTGGVARAHVADISQKLALQTILNDIEDEWGRIDVLINNTRVMPSKPLLEMDEWDWRRTLDVNLTGAFLLTQVVGRIMRAQGGGTIIHLLELDESKGNGAYAATQGGVVRMAHIAQEELERFGIRVHAIKSNEFSIHLLIQKIFAILS